MKSLLALLLASLPATSLSAHPHVFIDTGFELIVNAEGELTHLRVIWEYDELYSLLITEDMALDPDGDGVLSEAEIGQLTGFDMNWVEGFNGDLVLAAGAGPVPLSGPREITASFADGRITTTHLRALERPVLPGQSATIKPYDATYYTAYDITRAVTVTGGGACSFEIKLPDLSSGLLEQRAQLAALDAQTDPADAGLPDIGAELASSVIVTCAAP